MTPANETFGWDTVDLMSVSARHKLFAHVTTPHDLSRSSLKDYQTSGGYTLSMFDVEIYAVMYHFDATALSKMWEGKYAAHALDIAKTTVLEFVRMQSVAHLAHCGDDLHPVTTGYTGGRLLKPIRLQPGEPFRIEATTQRDGTGVSLRVTLAGGRSARPGDGLRVWPGTDPTG